jgi:hypothetical protein
MAGSNEVNLNESKVLSVFLSLPLSFTFCTLVVIKAGVF